MKRLSIWRNLLIILMLTMPYLSFYSCNADEQPLEIWVDDDFGPGTPGWQHNHFNSIQDGIDAVGETGIVFVHNGTYYEHILVNKTINLIGEDRNTTIIDAMGGGNGIYLPPNVDDVIITNFSIRNITNGIYAKYSDGNIISKCIIYNSTHPPSPTHAIMLAQSHHNTIIDCHLSNIYTGFGIYLVQSHWNNISNCIVSNNEYGIQLVKSDNNTLNGCNVFAHDKWYGEGISIRESFNNIIRNSHIHSNNLGLILFSVTPPEPANNLIYHNNFDNNTINAQEKDSGINTWHNGYPSGGNYWSDYQGDDTYKGIYQDLNGGDGIGDIPYNITGGNNRDLYPLMYPWYSSHPDVVYVDDGYNASIPGWGYDRFNRIQYGINEVQENGTVNVYNGIYYENVVINKSINLIGENINNTLIDGSGNEDIIYVASDSVLISGFSLQNSGTGFPFDAGIEISSSDNIINGNTFKNTCNGITLGHSCNNIISYNQFEIGQLGINLGGNSKNNTIEKNIIGKTNEGIRVSGGSAPSTCKIINNTIQAYTGLSIDSGGNYLRNNEFIDCGIVVTLGKKYNDIDTSNTINGRPIYYYFNKSDLTIPVSAGAVFLVQCESIIVSNLNLSINSDAIAIGWCENITIANNTIQNYGHGIKLWSSCNNTVINNILKNKDKTGLGILLTINSDNNLINNNYIESIRTPSWLGRGIDIVSSKNNIITNNTVKDHGDYGIWLYGDSNNNVIYHNALINNRMNADECSNFWDNGYPSGGNYWSDYNGWDIYQGPYQDIPGGDGIGDTPYDVPGDSNQDRYPLMHPYGANVVEFQAIEPLYTTEYMEVAISIDPKEAIAGAQFDMAFDPSMLSVDWVAEGNVFSGYDTYFDPGIIDNINGTLKNVVSLITTPGSNTTDQGSITIVAIRAKIIPGETSLNLSNVIVGRPDATPIDITIINTTVTIQYKWDLNGDDHVNILDLILIGQHWGETGSPCWIPADVNCDGVVNILDMILVGQHWTG